MPIRPDLRSGAEREKTYKTEGGRVRPTPPGYDLFSKYLQTLDTFITPLVFAFSPYPDYINYPVVSSPQGRKATHYPRITLEKKVKATLSHRSGTSACPYEGFSEKGDLEVIGQSSGHQRYISALCLIPAGLRTKKEQVKKTKYLPTLDLEFRAPLFYSCELKGGKFGL